MRGQPSLTPYHMSPDTCPVEFPRRGHDHHVSQARARQPYEARQRGDAPCVSPHSHRLKVLDRCQSGLHHRSHFLLSGISPSRD